LYSAVFTKYGFTPGLGASFILRDKLGEALASEMMLTAATYQGSELSRRGANVTIKPETDVLKEALRIAGALAEKPAHTLAILKASLDRKKLEQLPRVIAEELRMHRETFGHPEVKRRINQFIRETEKSSSADLPASVPVPEASAGASRRVQLKTLGAAADDR